MFETKNHQKKNGNQVGGQFSRHPKIEKKKHAHGWGGTNSSKSWKPLPRRLHSYNHKNIPNEEHLWFMFFLVVFNPFAKILVKMGSSSLRIGMNIKNKYLKLPPSF